MAVDYRMQNPMDSFFNTVGGLQQIESNQMNMQQRQQQAQIQQQQQQAAQAQQQRISELMPLVKSGDYNATLELATVSPELSSAIEKAKSGMAEGQDRATANWIAGYQAAPDKDAYLVQDNQSIDIDDQFRQMPIEQREVLTKIVGAQVMPEQMFKATFSSEAGAPQYSNIQFNESGTPYGLNKQTGAYEEVGGGFQRAKPTAQTVVNVGKAEGEQQKTIAKAEGGLYNEIQKSGFQSRKSDATLSRLEKLSDKAFDGATAGAYKGAAKLAESIGIDVEGLTETELFTALSNDLVLGQTALLTGVLTDKDMAFLEQTVPQLSQTKEGRKQLIGIMKDVNEANREKAQLAKDFRKLNDGYFDSAAFDEFMANRKPKDRFAPKDDVKGGAPSVGAVVQGYEFLGGNPADQSSWRKI